MKHDPKAALRRWREAQRLTIRDCADRLDVSARSLQRWEGTTREENHGRRKLFAPPHMLSLLVTHNIQLPEA